MTAATFIQGIVGLFWTATYIEIAYRGNRDRTYGMPLVALWFNITWEFYWSFIQRPPGQDSFMSTAQIIVDTVWLIFDVFIVYTVVRYGPREFPSLRKGLFYLGIAATAPLTAVIEVMLTRGFDHLLVVPLVFGSNLMMSGLFISMLLARRSRRGQSVTIAVNKMLGSALAAVGVWLYAPSSLFTATALLPVLYIATFVLDLAYVVMIATMFGPARPRAAVRSQELVDELGRTPSGG